MNKYNTPLDLETKNSLSLIVERIKPNSRILEFGPANGRLTKHLKEKMNCKVYCVELDKESAKDANKYAEKIIIDDIENYNWCKEFQGLEFDYIIFADVLEHLYYPDKVIKKASKFLGDDGSILLSLPNIAHNAILLELFNDKFTYNKTGLLDNTHIRFFSKNSIDKFVKESGLEIYYETAVYFKTNETEFKYSLNEIDEMLKYVLDNHIYGNVYQFILELKKECNDKKNDLIYQENANLFFDTGSGFNNIENYKISFDYQNLNKMCFDFKKPIKNVKAIRFDPLEEKLSIKVDNVIVNGKLLDNNPFLSGGRVVDGVYKFNCNDPQIIYEFDETRDIENVVFNISSLKKLYIFKEEAIYKEQQIQEKEQQIQEKEQQVQEKEQQIQEKEQQIQDQNLAIVNLESLAQSMRIKSRVKQSIKIIVPQKVLKIAKFIVKNPSSISNGVHVLKSHGFKALANKILKVENLHDSILDYSYTSPVLTDKIKDEINSFLYKPLISIIMPVYNIDPKWLALAISSVENQWYKSWELCIVDDKSTNAKTIKYLKSLNSPKIKVKFLEKNLNISAASNEALKLATGKYIALMDNDDEITQDALYEVVKVINENNADFIYSDEDKLDINNKHTLPFFKPDYSYDLLLSLNYITHFAIIRKSIIDEIGGFRVGYEGAQDYDLFLRVIEKTDKIMHIPKILYGWRMLKTSTSLSSYTKPYAHEAGQRAIKSHFERCGIKAEVQSNNESSSYSVMYQLPPLSPLLSIIIPTKDGLDFLKTCIESIYAISTYQNYEIIILNNNSEKQETFDWFKSIQEQYKNIKVLDANYEFNWSKLNNHGIRESKGDVYLFLNNDIKVITPDWLERLIGMAIQPNIGTVGALLLFDDNTIQHSGVVLGMNGWADHVYRGMEQVHLNTPFVSPLVTRNVLASTGACLVISKKVIQDIGLFDEEFQICGSDVELSLRAYEKGYRNVLNAEAILYHYESKTRDSFVPECDFEMSKKAYERYWKMGDPFYNETLSLIGTTPIYKGNE